MKTRIRSKEFLSYDPKPHQLIIACPELLREFITPLQGEILDELIGINNHCAWIHIRQDTIAARLGCCRESVNRAIKKFISLGIITTFYRQMTTNLYKLATWFHLPEIRRKLAHFLPKLWFLRIVHLFAIVTQLTEPGYLDLSKPTYPTCYRESLWAVAKEMRNSHATDLESFRKEAEIRVNLKDKKVNGENPISQAIRDVTEPLGLTRNGQIELSKLPDHAVTYAFGQLQTSKLTPRDPVRWVLKIGHEYCEREGLKKEWVRYDELKKQFPYPPEAPLTRVPGRQQSKPQQQQPKPLPQHKLWQPEQEPVKSIEEIDSEIEKFDAFKLDASRNEGYNKLFGPGSAEGYLGRVLANLHIERAKVLESTQPTNVEPLVDTPEPIHVNATIDVIPDKKTQKKEEPDSSLTVESSLQEIHDRIQLIGTQMERWHVTMRNSPDLLAALGSQAEVDALCKKHLDVLTTQWIETYALLGEGFPTEVDEVDEYGAIIKTER